MIKKTKLSEIANDIGAQLIGMDSEFSAVSINTRTIQSGELFVALEGEQFDGHQYLSVAKEKNACGAVVNKDTDIDIPLLKVLNTEKALGQIGLLNRKLFEGPVIAITGSNGKTTVKEMAANILALKGKVLATEGNLNNTIGLPLMLSRIDDDHDFAVIELGTNSMGEIAYLSQLTLPHVAVINNVSNAHLEGFGHIDSIVHEKGQIITGLQEDGKAVINLDDSNAGIWLMSAKQYQLITFSLINTSANFYAKDLVLRENGAYQFVLITPNGEAQINMKLVGKHNVSNALAAAAASMAVGATIDEVKNGLESMASIKGRMFFLTPCRNINIIDDTYNASPNSVCAAIDVLIKQPGRTILVLGNMAELGNASEFEHKKVVTYAQQQGVDNLFVVGEFATMMNQQFGENSFSFAAQEDLMRQLIHLINQLSNSGERMTILVKGSRQEKMENVINALVKELNNDEDNV